MATAKPPSPQRPLMQTNVKPPSPLLAPEQQPLKPPSPLRRKNAPKTPISPPQRRCRFQSHTSTSAQRRWRFQTTGPAGLQDPDAIPVGGGRARPGFEPTHPATRQYTRLHWCGGRRRVRRARAGFEIDHSEPLGSRVAISRAAGPDGARNTRGAASNTTAAPTTQRNEAATGCPATASSRSRSAVHNSATSNQAVMST